MLELELQKYLRREYPQENARCEWKEFKNLKNSFCGDEKDDVISYVSAIANMEGGFLVVGVHDKTLEIVGTDTYNPTEGDSSFGENGACPPTRSDSIHPLVGRKTVLNWLEKTEHCRSLVVRDEFT